MTAPKLQNLLTFDDEFQKNIRNWRNLPDVTKYFQIEHIDENTHAGWLKSLHDEPKRNIAFVILFNDEPVGLAYLSKIDTIRCDFGIYLHRSDIRNKNLGSFALEECIKYAKNTLCLQFIDVEVLENNIPSTLLFEKHGFKYTGTTKSITKSNENIHVNNYTLDLL